MFLDNFYSTSNNNLQFSRQQASDFAKKIADDFNPLHDITAKRFCVPGDLLFSLILAKSGLSQEMTFEFSALVSNDIPLSFPSKIDGKYSVSDEQGKEYLHVSASGEKTQNLNAIESLICAYVEFSGHTFPHILVKLMAEKNVMINPARPMIMYESMSIHLDNVAFESVKLVESNSTLSIDGKRGNACLEFDLVSDNVIIGHGKKHMLLSGLREYCQSTIDNIVQEYNDKKTTYFNAII